MDDSRTKGEVMYKFIGALSYTILIATGSFIFGAFGTLALEAGDPKVRRTVLQKLQEFENLDNAKETTSEE